jgi:hypothetical protein
VTPTQPTPAAEAEEAAEPTRGDWKWHHRHGDHDIPGTVFSELHPGHAYAVAVCPRYQTPEQWAADAPLLAAAKVLREALAAWISVAAFQGATVPADITEWAAYNHGPRRTEDVTREVMRKLAGAE